MPKIIENLREQLLCETKRQITANGYAKTTVRSVASACGVGVGTVYNYFKSKDMLIASLLLGEWQACLAEMRRCAAESAEQLLPCIYTSLKAFMREHEVLFRDSEATKVFAAAFAQRHKQLRDQLTEIILPVCGKTHRDSPEFLAEFVAEALLTWTVAGKDEAELLPVLSLLFK